MPYPGAPQPNIFEILLFYPPKRQEASGLGKTQADCSNRLEIK